MARQNWKDGLDQLGGMKTQLARQAALLREALEVVERSAHAFDQMRMVDKYHLFYGEDETVEQIESDLAALAPRLRRELEGE